MSERDVDDLCSRALEMFGAQSQLDVLQEECGELVAAVSQYRRGRITAEQLVSEMADVRVVLRQMAILFADVFAGIEPTKYERLRCRLDGVGEFANRGA